MAQNLIERMTGAALLDIDTFEEVEHDTEATTQAGMVVAMVAVASAIGASPLGIFGAVKGAVAALVGWLVWALITYLVGQKIFDGTATWGELLRTLGFAQTPGILLLFGFFPLVGWVLNLAVPLWMLVAAFIAIRQALDFGNGKTFATVIVGWGVYAFLNVVF